MPSAANIAPLPVNFKLARFVAAPSQPAEILGFAAVEEDAAAALAEAEAGLAVRIPVPNGAMHRLFVAIRPPQHIRDLLLDRMGGVSGARWQDEDQLHLTLRFIGEVDRHQAADVDAVLGAIHHSAFDMRLNGAGIFDRRGVPTTLWAGIAPADPVTLLHKKVDQAIARAGLPPERRAFHPHITMARLGRDSGSVQGFMSAHGGMSSPAFAVDAFCLVESRLTPDGAVYTEVSSYKLDPSPRQLDLQDHG